MRLSIIIPCFNEEKTIKEVLKRVIQLSTPKVTKEVIIVDDGSNDRSVANIKDQISKIKEGKLIVHEKNLGKGMAVRTGIKNSTGDYIIIQDADLEYNPKFIPELLKPIITGKTQVVYGTRLKRLPHLRGEEKTFRFLLHYFGNRSLSFLTGLLYGQFLTDIETGYKIFPKKAIENLPILARGFDFEPEITAKLLKRGYRILEIPIVTNPRGYKEGKKLNTFKDGLIALWSLLKYRFVD